MTFVQTLNFYRRDKYAVVREPTLLPTVHVEPADYTPVGTHTLERESTIEDVCDFVVEYINSDILVRLVREHLDHVAFAQALCRVCCQIGT